MFETIELFGEKVDIKNYCCSKNGEPIKRTPMKLNLYIKVTDMCNANCSVCSNRGNEKQSEIDYKKLKYVISYLDRKNLINRIGITGGEPFLDPDRLNKVLNVVFNAKPNALVTINTNGFNIKECLKLDDVDELYGIHISRHHYDDDINNRFFGINVASKEDILNVIRNTSNPKLLRLNCLLMKSYINNIDEVSKYLDMAGDLGIFRCGFVSLMPINEESIKEFVDFNDVFNNLSKYYLSISRTKDLDICECLNGAYLSNTGHVVEYYARMTKELDCPYARQLVYTSDNHLTTGFNKKNII